MSLNPRLAEADWRGRSAWLVGASSGIGRATASRLHALGAQVVVPPQYWRSQPRELKDLFAQASFGGR